MATDLKRVPRTLVTTYLRAARLPLALAQRAVGQRDNALWAPAVAFESAESSVEMLLGGFLRDDELFDRGRMRQAKVAQLREAIELGSTAEQVRQRADQTFEQRRADAEQRRTSAEKDAQARTEQVTREAEQHERAIERDAQQAKGAARKAAAKREQAIARQERTAKLATLDEESRALSTAQAAIDADKTADAIDRAIETSKAVRRSG